MKKYIYFLAVAFLAVAFQSCSKSDDNQASTNELQQNPQAINEYALGLFTLSRGDILDGIESGEIYGGLNTAPVEGKSFYAESKMDIIMISALGTFTTIDHNDNVETRQNIGGTVQTMGKNITRIGNRAFKNCEVMNSLTCYNIKTIGDEAFHSCKSIVKWDFVNCQLETIGEDAFYWNTSLKIVGLPATLKSIASDGFYSCEALEEITCLAPVPPTCGNKNVFRYVDTSKCKLLVPQGSINAYKAAEVWKDFFNIETDLNGISSDAEASAEWFDLRGRSINAPRKGLNIIRQGGKTQKVIVR